MHISLCLPHPFILLGAFFATTIGVLATPTPGANNLERRACTTLGNTYCVGDALTFCTDKGEEVTLAVCENDCTVTKLGSGATAAWCGAVGGSVSSRWWGIVCEEGGGGEGAGCEREGRSRKIGVSVCEADDGRGQTVDWVGQPEERVSCELWWARSACLEQNVGRCVEFDSAVASCTPGTKYCIDDMTIGTCASDRQTLINAERCKHYCARLVIDGEEQGICAILIDRLDPGYTPTPRPTTTTTTGIIPSRPPRS